MTQSKALRVLRHVFGVVVASGVAFLVWTLATGVAWSPILARGDESARSYEDPLVVRFCGQVVYGMDYPFLWIRPQSFLDGPRSFALMSLFWGCILYLLFHVFRRLRHHVA
jgi:hypothetical protein